MAHAGYSTNTACYQRPFTDYPFRSVFNDEEQWHAVPFTILSTSLHCMIIRLQCVQ